MGNDINWGMERSAVRLKVMGSFEESNSVIDMSEYNNGISDFDIHQRRDIYNNIDNKDCLVFFNYDKFDRLRDIEIHYGVSLKLATIIINIDEDTDKIVSELSQLYGADPSSKNSGNFLFENLNLVIANEQSIGGTANTLAYIYISSDISHLMYMDR